jgi:Fe-Mn family superoxide dismutase
MKALITFDDTKFVKKDKELINKFVKFLQSEYPLKDDVTISLMGHRTGKMSTGARTNDSEIKVLAKNRLNRDIMRTLAHEWVHEHQRNVLNREHGPDIGGQNEDEANAFAGQLVKKFEKKYPHLEPKMYEMKSINSKLDLLSEQILLTEKQSIEETLLLEMKKIGIDKLPYSYSSLQRFIDSKTMNVHYNKHYKGYVDKLNKSIKDKKGDMDLEEIIRSISKFDDKVRNNAGGAFNHALFWKMLSPKKQLPKGEILKKITKDFGNIKKMKDEFNEVAKDRFGSGWAWLYLGKDGKLKIMSTPNQDNPLMNVIKNGGYPLLGLDVWEHAYYLKYQNKRDEYIKKFWDAVNWEFVEELYLSKTKKDIQKESLKESQIITENRGFSKVLNIPTKTIESIYLSVYPPCDGSNKTNGCIGMIKDPNCETGLGVIGGNYSEKNFGGVSDWSIINRFDTNGNVHQKILEFYKNDKDPTKGRLETWMKKNAQDLFGNDGEKIKPLIDLNSDTIRRGGENEKYAIEVLENVFGDRLESITQMCSGDLRDRHDGQDLEAKIDGKEYFYQVKPVNFKIARIVNSERGMYYKIPIALPADRYKEDKVDFYIFVDVSNEKYAIFYNEKKYISSEGGQYGGLKFYKPNMYSTNVDFTTYKPRNKPITPKMERDKDSQIQYYEEMIKYYSDKLKELGQSEEISERKKYYMNKLVKLLK